MENKIKGFLLIPILLLVALLQLSPIHGFNDVQPNQYEEAGELIEQNLDKLYEEAKSNYDLIKKNSVFSEYDYNSLEKNYAELHNVYGDTYKIQPYSIDTTKLVEDYIPNNVKAITYIMSTDDIIDDSKDSIDYENQIATFSSIKKEQWDSGNRVKMHITVYYSETNPVGMHMVLLTSVTGGYSASPSTKLVSQSVTYGCSGVGIGDLNVSQSKTMSPVNRPDWFFNSGFTTYIFADSCIMGAYANALFQTNNSTTWTFRMTNNVVD